MNRKPLTAIRDRDRHRPVTIPDNAAGVSGMTAAEAIARISYDWTAPERLLGAKSVCEEQTTMVQTMMRESTMRPRWCVWICVASLLFSSGQAFAQSSEQFPALLKCSELSTEPVKWPAYTQSMMINRSGNTLTGVRAVTIFPGEEIYRGTIDANGVISLIGEGKHYGVSSWTKTFSGQIGATTLNGGEHSSSGGTRDCTITVQRPIR